MIRVRVRVRVRVRLLRHTVGGEDEEEVHRLHRMHADLRSGDEPAPVSLEVAEAARNAQPRP